MGIEYKDNGKCRLVVYAGSDAYGRPIRRVKTVSYTSKRNAMKQYRDFEAEVEADALKESTAPLSEIIDDYIRSRKRKGVRATTIHGYNAIKKRIDDTLGDPVASKVTRSIIDKWISKLDEKYSAKTIKNTVQFLSACYERCIDLEELKKNPCRHADIPSKPPKARRILDEEEVHAFYKALDEEDDIDFTVAIELMLFCGLRRSEVMGLRERNIDLKKQTVHVEDARHRVDGLDVMEGTKTVRSNRVLSLPDFVFEDITKCLSVHKENRLRDANLPLCDYLILDAYGEPMHPTALYKKLKAFEAKHSLPDVSLHELRHTYASMLKWSGRDLVEISSQLGHSQQSTTLNTYTHLFQDAMIVSKDIADEIDEMVISK